MPERLRGERGFAPTRLVLVFLSDLHKERLQPGREATIGRKGCSPAAAVRERDDTGVMVGAHGVQDRHQRARCQRRRHERVYWMLKYGADYTCQKIDAY
jgi:hypothetical protein